MTFDFIQRMLQQALGSAAIDYGQGRDDLRVAVKVQLAFAVQLLDYGQGRDWLQSATRISMVSRFQQLADEVVAACEVRT